MSIVQPNSLFKIAGLVVMFMC